MTLRFTTRLLQKSKYSAEMNRPRNRQPRPNRGQNNSRGQHRGGQRGSHNHINSRPAYSPVPTVDRVVVGSEVSIVLKQDQTTGREVQGVVQDLLTRGNHPRGIKVRLNDGRVGRVQRMVGDGTGPMMPQSNSRGQSSNYSRDSSREALEGPPPRTFADYINFPSDDEAQSETTTQGTELAFKTATAKCPICGLYEGDEVAVTRHVEQEHLT